MFVSPVAFGQAAPPDRVVCVAEQLAERPQVFRRREFLRASELFFVGATVRLRAGLMHLRRASDSYIPDLGRDIGIVSSLADDLLNQSYALVAFRGGQITVQLYFDELEHVSDSVRDAVWLNMLEVQ